MQVFENLEQFGTGTIFKGCAMIELLLYSYNTMIYWLPWLENTGKLPVWSVAIFPVGVGMSCTAA